MLNRQMNVLRLMPSSSALKGVGFVFVSLPILAGCALTPDAKRPVTISSIERLEGYTSTDVTSDAPEPNAWWRAMGDAEINSLVNELRIESLSLKELSLIHI